MLLNTFEFNSFSNICSIENYFKCIIRLIVNSCVCCIVDINIDAPINVSAQRLNDGKALEVSWLSIDSPLILSYDVEYRIFKTTGSSGFPSTIINSPGSINVKLIISDVDNNTNYEVRVRGLAEDPRTSEEVVINGPWSQWYVSQVRLDPGKFYYGHC